MDKYFEFSKSKDESRLSIDSQELLRQVETKIHKAQSPTFISPQKEQLNYADHFDQKEQIDYLSFKEQTIIKRLLNLRDDYKQFQKNVQRYQEQLMQSIKETLKKVADKGNRYLQEQEYELRLQLQEIQKNKELLKSHSNCQIIQSPLKQQYHLFQEIANKVSELNYQILEFFDQDNSIQSNRYQKKLNFSNYKELSSNKKFKASPSPFKEIDRVLQLKTSSSKPQLLGNNSPKDLNQFIEVLKLKINNTKNNNLLQSRSNFSSNFLISKLNINSKRLSIEQQLQSQNKIFFQSVF
ncbi:unnamed protein product (macronuclear) [Paramecium tetraurelia]|uniref:SPX domain-containing protein n=1 Tax=Paramecium tetraurelia TaxID=5888 RepID=A0BUH9_PARTE|nr:uncharacterized protein GSPATT00032428001 [Paramecium tetraurelia]CAK62196.1 unnamed protein product [Paramecium tetraurelia]|eukprot:XP_001429594.1 hypothetical protein (macronuclear) [Paramecium tetraurelia strain d4-2]